MTTEEYRGWKVTTSVDVNGPHGAIRVFVTSPGSAWAKDVGSVGVHDLQRALEIGRRRVDQMIRWGQTT